MKKQLTKQDIIKLLDDDSKKIEITRPSSHCVQVKITPKMYKCFGCDKEFKLELLQIRLDARVTSLTLPKKFCNRCVITLDDILSRLKSKVIPSWQKSLK